MILGLPIVQGDRVAISKPKSPLNGWTGVVIEAQSRWVFVVELDGKPGIKTIKNINELVLIWGEVS